MLSSRATWSCLPTAAFVWLWGEGALSGEGQQRPSVYALGDRQQGREHTNSRQDTEPRVATRGLAHHSGLTDPFSKQILSTSPQAGSVISTHEAGGIGQKAANKVDTIPQHLTSQHLCRRPTKPSLPLPRIPGCKSAQA